jgi:hypothetical protein
MDEKLQWWRTHPWRLIQTNLREIDMADMDAERYAEDMVEMGATIAMINTGGIIASYPTELENHFQSPYLTGDSLVAVIDACHARGIRVIARNDLSKIRRPIYERHPQWAYRTCRGDIVDYNGNVHACLNGGYQQDQGPKIVREILEKLPVDGMFFNMGGFQVRDYSYNHYGICHCDSCRRRFLERTGHELPAIEDLSDPIYRAYESAKRDWVAEFEAKIHALIQSVRPGVAVNHFEFMRQESNTEFGRPLPRWPYDASSNTRWVRTSLPGTVRSNTSVDFVGFYYRHVAVNPAQQEMRLWQSLANGGALDYYLIGRLDNHRDRSGFDRVKKVFTFHKNHEDLYSDLISEADVLLVRRRGPGLTREERGWIRMLSESHYLFDEVRIESLRGIDLSKYRTLIVPDVLYMSDEQARAIDAFVSSGGSLLATGRSGFYNEDFEPRAGSSLESLGITKVRSVRTDMRSALFEKREHDGLSPPIDTELFFFGDTYVYADYDDSVEGHLGLIPPHNYGPPERCYYTQKTDLPGFTVRRGDGGGAVYLPWLPGELFDREGYVNTSALCVSLLRNALSLRPIDTDAPPMCEITLQRKATGIRVLSVVNMTGHYGPSFVDPVPLNGITARLIAESKPELVVSLRSGREIEHSYDGSVLRLTFDVRDSAECILIA